MGKQKRSANTYQKINGVFYRDTNNIVMMYDELCDPVLEWLRTNDVKMYATEKIDGTNIRIEVSSEVRMDRVYFDVAYKGKTDNANIPKNLETHLKEKYSPEVVLNALGLKPLIPFEEFAAHKWVDEKGEPDTSRIPTMYTIYGEGYGKGIQKVGGRYIKDGSGFIVFDVKVNNTWLMPEAVKEIAGKLGAPYVPEYGPMTINEAIRICQNEDWKSQISEDKTLPIEGIVLKTPWGLLDRMGRRIICKVKVCDFEKYKAKYGTTERVPQERNPKLNNND